MSKAVLVTGGAGYIGAHVCKALANAGYTPVTYDNLSSGVTHAVQWGPFVEADILDFDALDQTIQKHNIKAVIHLAAFISVAESVASPDRYYQNNSVGGLTVLQAMVKNQVKAIVFSSTAAVYGEPKQVPIVEDAPIAPINPYGHSKAMVEQFLRDFDHAFAIKSVALRYFNVAGADADCDIGCEHEKPNNLVPIIMNVQSGKQAELNIFGDDYDTPDGTCVRDYIHVTDLANAHIDSLKYLEQSNASEAFNLGTGKGCSVTEVVDSASRVTGKLVPYTFAPRRDGDPSSLYANSDKAQRYLGWKPHYTNLDDITASAWAWQQKMLNR